MGGDSKRKWSTQVGFRLKSAEKRQKLEEVRVKEGYTNLTEFMRALVDEKIEEVDGQTE